MAKAFVQRDTAVTGKYYVDASGSGGGGVNYSTDEQDTGLTWIDGSKIYEKTVVLESVSAGLSQTIAHGITGIAQVIGYDLMPLIAHGGLAGITLNSFNSATASINAQWSVSCEAVTDTNIVLTVGSSIVSDITQLAVRIRYLKTTEE